MAYVTDALPQPAMSPSYDDEFVQHRHQTWRKFKRHRLALTGALVLFLMVCGAIFAPWLSHFDPNAIDPHWGGTPLAPGQFGHWLGTDEVGRDLYTRLLFGARISLTLATVAVIIEVVLGTLIGAVSGFYGGWIDGLLMRLTDTFLSIPLLPLLLVLTGIVAASSSKASLNFSSIVIIIGLLSWMNVARLVRGQFLTLREQEFAEAARAIGCRDARIVAKHL